MRYLFMTKSKTTWHISQHLILNNWDICSWPKAKQPDTYLNNWDICCFFCLFFFNLKQLRYLFMTKSKTTWHISQLLILNNWDICSWPKAWKSKHANHYTTGPPLFMTKSKTTWHISQHLMLNNWDICSWPKAKQPDTYLNI